MAWQDDGADWWKPKPEGGWHEADDEVYRDADWWKSRGKPKSPVKIPIFAHFYAWTFVVGWIMWPVVFIIIWPGSVISWLVVGGWIALTLASFRVAGRCSGDKLTYWDCMLIVCASAMTGWTYIDMLVVFPRLLHAYGEAVCSGFSADAPKLFHDFVFSMHQRRMRQ